MAAMRFEDSLIKGQMLNRFRKNRQGGAENKMPSEIRGDASPAWAREEAFSDAADEKAADDGMKKSVRSAGVREKAADVGAHGIPVSGSERKDAAAAGRCTDPAGLSAEHAQKTSNGKKAGQSKTGHRHKVAGKKKGKERIFRILLITNRDSDNLGDLVIEACDLSLLRTVMKNLGIAERDYEIISRAASMISRKYTATKDPALLETAEHLIADADVVFFGGAPMFNYSYQIFYERTAVTLELAQKYQKPVIFSAMGVEKYRENDERCQRLKTTLNFPCVRCITTRDDYESLCGYVDAPHIVTAQVADPAVFSREVFADFISGIPKSRRKKKVGVFVLRNDGFKTNGIDFSRDDAVHLWLDLIEALTKQGYDYTLLANGHFGDEAFLDYLIRECGIPGKKCVFNIDSPEKFVARISIYDAVISCRLHPSIISCSLGVPSLGIVWNPKVAQFYHAAGYDDRAFAVEKALPEKIVARLNTIIDKKPGMEPSYRMSVYTTMFDALKEVLSEAGLADAQSVPYTYEELLENLVRYEGTSPVQKEKYMVRKIRRTYDHYNRLEMKENAAKEK